MLFASTCLPIFFFLLKLCSFIPRPRKNLGVIFETLLKDHVL